MKKSLLLLMIMVACGSETEEDRTLDEMSDSMREFVSTCETCIQNNIIPSVTKIVEEFEAEDTICWTWVDGGLIRLGVGLKSSYLKGRNLKDTINKNTQECLLWAGS